MSNFSKEFRIRVIKAVFENLSIYSCIDRMEIYEDFRNHVLNKRIDELDIGYISTAFKKKEAKKILFDDMYAVEKELYNSKERTIADREFWECKKFFVHSMIRIFDFIEEYARYKIAKERN